MCRELQMLCSETREKAFNVVTLSKTLRKDLETMVSEGNCSSLCCNVIADALAQMKVIFYFKFTMHCIFSLHFRGPNKL